MKSNDAPIVQKSYDLLKESITVVNKFPRSQKFTLGDRIQNKLTDLLDIYIRALYAPKPAKKSLLTEANIQLEMLRHYYRLAYDLGLFHSIKYQFFAEYLLEIGRMTGAWIKFLEK